MTTSDWLNYTAERSRAGERRGTRHRGKLGDLTTAPPTLPPEETPLLCAVHAEEPGDPQRVDAEPDHRCTDWKENAGNRGGMASKGVTLMEKVGEGGTTGSKEEGEDRIEAEQEQRSLIT